MTLSRRLRWTLGALTAAGLVVYVADSGHGHTTLQSVAITIYLLCGGALLLSSPAKDPTDD